MVIFIPRTKFPIIVPYRIDIHSFTKLGCESCFKGFCIDCSHVKRPLSPEPQAEPVSLGTYPRLPKMEQNGPVTFEERHEGYAAQKINVMQHDSAINSGKTRYS
jgi:hypothetical protein